MRRPFIVFLATVCCLSISCGPKPLPNDKLVFVGQWEAHSGFTIDIKANGAPYTEEARQEFQKALPARLPGSGVRYGITACLVGRLLDIVWEGESSFIELDSGVVRARARSEGWTGYQGLVVSLEL